jgi:hypothetical protein
MRKTIGSLLPLAVGLAALGIAIAWLLGHDMAIGAWLLAAVIVGHGWVHAMFLLPRPPAEDGAPAWPFDMSRSWPVVRGGLPLGPLRTAGAALIAAVVVAGALAALATVGIVVPAGWWPALVAGSAVGSAVLLVLFFDPQLILGLAIDAALVWLVAASAWVPAAA